MSAPAGMTPTFVTTFHNPVRWVASGIANRHMHVTVRIAEARDRLTVFSKRLARDK